MNKNIKVVVFDLGNVLLTFDYSSTVKRLNSISSGLGDKFTDFQKANYEFHRNFERGTVSNEIFISKMISILENKIDGETFCKFYSEIFTENTPIIKLIPELKKKYQLILLSNTNDIHYQYGWKNYSFIRYFDKLILSHEIKSVKPEEKIFKAAESFSNKQPSEHIFIDDILAYSDAAKNLGWQSIQYKSPEQLQDKFKEIGVI